MILRPRFGTHHLMFNQTALSLDLSTFMADQRTALCEEFVTPLLVDETWNPTAENIKAEIENGSEQESLYHPELRRSFPISSLPLCLPFCDRWTRSPGHLTRFYSCFRRGSYRCGTRRRDACRWIRPLR